MQVAKDASDQQDRAVLSICMPGLVMSMLEPWPAGEEDAVAAGSVRCRSTMPNNIREIENLKVAVINFFKKAWHIPGNACILCA